MVAIGNIKVNSKGKTAEQIKQEVMEKVSQQVDTMLGEVIGKKEEVKEEPKEGKVQAHMYIMADEAKDKSGFGVQVDFEGSFNEVITMFTVGVAQALHNIANDNENEYDSDLLVRFIGALVHEYTNGTEEVEAPNGK